MLFRSPVGPQIHFASESFMDEIAASVGADPVEFRLRYLKAPRDIAVVKAAAEKAGWVPRPSPRRDQSSSGNAVGRGIAYSQRSGTVVAIVAEMLMGGYGVGGAMWEASRMANSRGVFAGIVEIAVVGWLLVQGMAVLRRRLLAWHPEADEGKGV